MLIFVKLFFHQSKVYPFARRDDHPAFGPVPFFIVIWYLLKYKPTIYAFLIEICFLNSAVGSRFSYLFGQPSYLLTYFDLFMPASLIELVKSYFSRNPSYLYRSHFYIPIISLCFILRLLNYAMQLVYDVLYIMYIHIITWKAHLLTKLFCRNSINKWEKTLQWYCFLLQKKNFQIFFAL